MSNSTQIFDSITLLQCYDIDKNKVRIGSDRDGGYVYADIFDDNCPIISFGVSDNCDFEFEMADKGHPIFMYDYSVDGPPRSHDGFSFRKLKVVGKNTSDADNITIEQVIETAGLSDRTDLILKMDIEGSEYEALSKCSRKILRCFKQIAVEIHWLTRLPDPDFRKNFNDCMNLINKDFVLHHVHANNCATVQVVGGAGPLHLSGGLTVADVLELSYVRKDCVVARDNKTIYPTHLDMANHPQFPDHILCFYPFMPGSESLKDQLRKVCEINDLKYKIVNG